MRPPPHHDAVSVRATYRAILPVLWRDPILDTKAKAGRPQGSSRYNNTDPALLAGIADKMADQPGLSLHAAIFQVTGSHEDSRLRRKFNASRSALEAAARGRQAAKREQQAQQAAARRQQAAETMVNLLTSEVRQQVAMLAAAGTRLTSTEYAIGMVEQIEAVKRAAPMLKIMGMNYIQDIAGGLRLLAEPAVQQAIRSELGFLSSNMGRTIQLIGETAIRDKERYKGIAKAMGLVAQ